MTDTNKLLVQCDFDGTVTIEDAFFAILDAYAPGKWEQMFEDHKAGKMNVGEFNTQSLAMVKADKESLLKLIDKKITLRPGFADFVRYCRDKGYRFVIVSNGLDFYIEHLLAGAGLTDVEFHASITKFEDGDLVVRHKGPDGEYLDSEVKNAFTDWYISQGYDIIYLGDGNSDLKPAEKCRDVYATGPLVDYCCEADLAHTPFDTFYEVIDDMETLL